MFLNIKQEVELLTLVVLGANILCILVVGESLRIVLGGEGGNLYQLYEIFQW